MPTTKKPRRTRRPKTTRPSFEKRVMSVVQKQAETKMKVVSIWNEQALLGSGLTGASGIQANLLSSIALDQGVEQEQRVGNKISNSKLRIRGFVQSNAYSASIPLNNNSFGYEVHVLAFKKKNDINNDPSVLKFLPANNTGPVDGTVMNSMYPYNKDAYTIKRVKVIRMQPTRLKDDVHNTGGNNFKRFSMDIPIAKNLKYIDTGTEPTNDWCALAFYVINADGTVEPTQARCNVSMDAVLTYDDF